VTGASAIEVTLSAALEGVRELVRYCSPAGRQDGTIMKRYVLRPRGARRGREQERGGLNIQRNTLLASSRGESPRVRGRAIHHAGVMKANLSLDFREQLLLGQATLTLDRLIGAAVARGVPLARDNEADNRAEHSPARTLRSLLTSQKHAQKRSRASCPLDAFGKTSGSGTIRFFARIRVSFSR